MKTEMLKISVNGEEMKVAWKIEKIMKR